MEMEMEMEVPNLSCAEILLELFELPITCAQR